KEIFLAQAKLLPGWGRIAGIENLGDRFGASLFRQRADVIAHVECLEAQRIDGTRRPQAQGIYVSAAPPHDRDVICDGLDGLVWGPDRAFDAGRRNRHLDPTTEVDVVDHFRPRELPRVPEGQPFLRVFLLPTIPDDLAEQSVIVANAVAVGRNSKGRHALHETGGESTKAAMAERRVRLNGSQPV